MKSTTPAVRLEVALAAADLLAAFLAMVGAMLVRYDGVVPAEHWLAALTWLPLFLAWRMAMAVVSGLYDFRRKLLVSDHVFAGMGAALFGVAPGYLFLALLQLYYAPLAQFSRAVAVMDLLLLATWYGASRAAVLAFLQHQGRGVRALLLGPAPARAALAEELRCHGPRLLTVAGEAELTETATGADAEALLDTWMGHYDADLVLLATSALTPECLGALVTGCDRRDVEVWVNPDVRLALFAGAEVFSMAGLPLVRLGPRAAGHWYGPVKRAADIMAAGAGLLVLSPVLGLAALAVRTSSAGPAFFLQERLGLHGKVFRVVKLRTMVAEAEADTGPVLAEEADPRITPLGRWLRQTRLDELPQLWNVLRGDMSLVGPRPERPAFAEQFLREDPLYRHRLLVRPGLTGLAQIHGRYDTGFRQKLRYDLIYLHSMSPVTDLRILAATARSVLTGRGAR